MSEFQIKKCPVCDSNDFSYFLTTTDFFVSGEQFDINHCNVCGLKVTRNAKDEEQNGKYYQSENYISHSNTGKGIVNLLYHLVRKYMLKKKRKLTEKTAGYKKGSLLDVGSGTGYFLNEMKSHGWQVTGIEKSSEARQFAAEKFEMDLKTDEEMFQMQDSRFDVITLWHVLEHIHRLSESMEAFFRLLKPNGKLVIAVPNRSSFDAKKYKEYWAAWDVPRHIWHFTPKCIRLLAQKHGLRVKCMYNMPFDSFYISILSEKYKQSSFPLIRGFITGKISWLISLTRKGRASSVVYVLE
ncbi:MAG: class I SAM-dependent methyltransferase, partial [Prolixibacteraceae bacterium]